MRSKPFVLAVSCVALLPWLSEKAQAQTATGWLGDGATNIWSDAANWDNGIPGGNTRALFFGFAFEANTGGNNFTTANNNLVGYAGHRITFEAGSSTAFTITGNSFTLFDFSGAFPRIQNDSTALQSFDLTAGQTLTLNGTNAGNKAEINPVNGDLLFTANTNLALAGNTQLQVFGNNSKTLTINSGISGAGTGGVQLNGTNTVIFGGANSYGGSTAINGGTLRVAGGAAIPDASAVTIANAAGATFDLNGTSETIGPLAGGGATGGTVTLGAGTLTIGGTVITDFAGVINGAGGKLTKSGTGTQTFSGAAANTYTGLTTVNGGVLALNKTAGTNAILGNLTVATGGTVNLLQSNQIADSSTITVSGGTINFSPLSGGTSGSNETFASLSMSSGSFNLLGAGITVTDVNNLNTVVITGAAAISGGTANVNSGTILSANGLALSGPGVVTVNGNSTLKLSELQVGSGGLTLTGATLNVFRGTTTGAQGGKLVLGGDVTFGQSSTTSTITTNTNTVGIAQLDLGGVSRTFSVADGSQADDATIGLTIANGGVTKTGAGTLRFTGTSANPNTYAGNTTVNDGILALGKTNAVNAIAGGSVTIGDGTGSADTLRLDASDQIASSVAVTVNNSGLFNVNGKAEAIASLTITGGSAGGAATNVDLGTNGTLNTGSSLTFTGGTINTGAAGTTGGVTLGGGITTNASSNTASISGAGFLALGTGGARTFTVADGTAASDLSISATISGSGGITKAGAGLLTLSGSNTYALGTTISAGTLRAGHNNALGTGSVTIQGTAVGTAADTGTLQLAGDITVGNAINLSNSRNFPSSAALAHVQNLSGNNKLTGNLTLQSTGGSGINVESVSGALELSGTITHTVATGRTHTFYGAGNGLVSGVIDNGASITNIRKEGTGTWTLTGNNTFTGTTTVLTGGGTLEAGAAGALGATSGVTVSNGGTLLLGGAGAVNRVQNAAPVTLGTSGVGGATFTLADGAREGSARGSEGTTPNTPGVGLLTLAFNSTLDFGSLGGAAASLVFGDFIPNGMTLSITDYAFNGTLGAGGTDGVNDRLIFTANQSSNLGRFSFSGFSGADQVAFNDGATTYYEIVPVPEPGTWLAAAGMLGLVGWRERKRLGRAFARAA